MHDTPAGKLVLPALLAVVAFTAAPSCGEDECHDIDGTAYEAEAELERASDPELVRVSPGCS
jgi:hypothetical protein